MTPVLFSSIMGKSMSAEKEGELGIQNVGKGLKEFTEEEEEEEEVEVEEEEEE